MKTACEIKENTMSIEALKRYGNHDWDCGLLLRCEDCTCGFAAAIKATQPSAISDERIMQIAKSVGMQGMLSDVVTTTDELKAFARALLSERPASAISDEVSVPREPTEAILEAIWGRPLTAHDTGARKIARAKYVDMLAAQEGK